MGMSLDGENSPMVVSRCSANGTLLNSSDLGQLARSGSHHSCQFG